MIASMTFILQSHVVYLGGTVNRDRKMQ